MIYGKFVDKVTFRLDTISKINPEKEKDVMLLIPTRKKHTTLSSDIPSNYIKEYEEAYRIITDSPKASAALSRRLLQQLLEEKGNIKKDDLSNEIQQVINSGQLRKNLADSIDSIRNIGAFGAHPLKSKTTDQIVEVEPGEAEWNLYILELLFDFYFVQPAEVKRKQDALNQKLKDLGKPPMKTSGSGLQPTTNSP
jgi:hypothetical protein